MGSLRKPLLNKKGQVDGFVTWFFIIVILFTIAIVLLVLNYTWGRIQTPLSEGLSSAIVNDTVNVSNTLEQTGSAARSFDSLIPLLIIGIFAFVMIVAGSIMKHPIMIFVGIIILGVLITLAVIYANVYQSIAETEEFSATNDSLPIQNKFMQYLPFIVIIGVIGISVSLLWRNQGGSQL